MILVIDMTINNYTSHLVMLKNYLENNNIKFNIISDIRQLCNFDYNKINGIIISGSSLSMIKLNEHKIDFLRKAIFPLILTKAPVLGICFGYQLLNYIFGGEIKKMKNTDNCNKIININNNHLLFKGKNKTITVKVYHQDQISKLSNLFEIIAIDNNNNIMAISNKKHKFYGVQFHPEALQETYFIIDNFLKKCKI
jgi:GMP synthase (glutamine-hydrolysing)